MQLAQDLVAVYDHAWLQVRWKGEVRDALEDIRFRLQRQIVYTDKLAAGVVIAAVFKSLFNQCIGAGLKRALMSGDEALQLRLGEEVMYAIGGKQQYVAFFHSDCTVVNLDMRICTHGAREVLFLFGYPYPVVAGELLQAAVVQAVDARITDMQNMSGGGFDNHATKGGNQPHRGVVQRVSLSAKPAID